MTLGQLKVGTLLSRTAQLMSRVNFVGAVSRKIKSRIGRTFFENSPLNVLSFSL